VNAALEKAAVAKSNDPIVLDLIGSVYSLMGDYGVAKDYFVRANNGQPNYLFFMLNLASNLIYHGDTNAAIALQRHGTGP